MQPAEKLDRTPVVAVVQFVLAGIAVGRAEWLAGKIFAAAVVAALIFVAAVAVTPIFAAAAAAAAGRRNK